MTAPGRISGGAGSEAPPGGPAAQGSHLREASGSLNSWMQILIGAHTFVFVTSFFVVAPFISS